MGYLLKGEWKNEGYKFFGEFFTRFEALMYSMNDPNSNPERSHIITIYLKEELKKLSKPVSGENNPDLVQIDLPPGTYIMQLVPYTIISGSPKNRPPQVFLEDLIVEDRAIKMLAIPAS